MRILDDETVEGLLDMRDEHPELATALAIGAFALWLFGDLALVLLIVPGLVSMHQDWALLLAGFLVLFLIWANIVAVMAAVKIDRAAERRNK